MRNTPSPIIVQTTFFMSVNVETPFVTHFRLVWSFVFDHFTGRIKKLSSVCSFSSLAQYTMRRKNNSAIAALQNRELLSIYHFLAVFINPYPSHSYKYETLAWIIFAFSSNRLNGTFTQMIELLWFLVAAKCNWAWNE